VVFDLKRFVQDCENAGGELNCADYISARLRYELTNPISMTAALPQYEDEEVLLHADDNITIFLIQLSPNLNYPPHNHNMATTIALCSGTESAAYFRLRKGKPEYTVSRTYTAGDMVFLPADVIHAVGNPGIQRSVALHIYYGNLPVMRRNLWDPESAEALPFTDENYFRLARPLDPALPFVQPDQTQWAVP
jgi:predicted metal-dependent enzyme (double-stranded beta helix superfamily)